MTDFMKLVERQLRLVEIKRECERCGERPPPLKVDEIRYGPCLLLSRECGSLGDEVSRLAGERLGWQVFNREIVEEIARREHVRNQLVESVDEQVRSRWRDRLHATRQRAGIEPAAYLYHLHEIVLTLGHQGDVVIVGRGAQYVLPGGCAVRVRIVEPLQTRLLRVATVRNLPLDEARHFVLKREADRAEFIRRVFQQDTTSPLNYDLTLNTNELGLEAAVETVLAALHKKLGVHLPLL